jgi:3-oxoacyl-[acyl-carrier protein] reductase
MNNFTNKNIIITGASKGIGKKIAESFYNNQANLFLISRDIVKLNNIKSILQKNENSNQTLMCYEGDVTNQNDISIIFKEIYKQFGSINVLINNAGITKDNIILKMKNDDWDSVINTNLTGTFNCCKLASKYMVKQREGKIINISSIIAEIGNIGQTNYAASKSGVIGLTKSLAKELASRNINVNVINPGYINTAMTNNLDDTKKNNYLSRIPLKRFGDTIDISNLALFLASDKSNYITGQSINVDGGLVMQ